MKTLPGVIIILAVAVFLMHRSWQNEKAEKDSELDKIKEEIRKLKEQQNSAECGNAENDENDENDEK